MPNIDDYRKKYDEDIVFGVKWFERHQSKLLWLLNAPIIKYWFRFCLRIRKDDIPLNQKIINIAPSNFSFKSGREISTDFRTHDKFAKRLYYAFKPFWYVLHAFDWALMDRVDALAKLSFGFSTLTAFSDPSSGSTTCDGCVRAESQNLTLTNLRAWASSNRWAYTNGVFSIMLGASSTTNQFAEIRRLIMTFNTSAIGSGNIISSVVLSIVSMTKTSGIGSPDFHIGGATPASNNNLVVTDYNQVQYTSFGSKTYASWVVDSATYNDITLNASGIANVSKTGISRFSAQTSWDINNSFTGTWGSFASSVIDSKEADETGTTKDPKLVITYAPPPPVNHTLTVSSASFALTLQNVNFVKTITNYVSPVSPAMFSLTMQNVASQPLVHNYTLNVEPALYVLTGQNVDGQYVIHNNVSLVTPAVFNLLFQDVVTEYKIHNNVVVVSPMFFTLTMQNALFRKKWMNRPKVVTQWHNNKNKI